MTAKNLYKNDYGFDLDFTLKDSDGAALDLTNATAVTFKMVKINGTITKVTGDCTIDEPKTLGTCSYTVQEGDLDEVGEFNYQIQITTASSLITCNPQEKINVLRKF